MATVNLKLNEEYENSDKTYPIVFVIRNRNSHAKISSGIKIEKQFWDEKKLIKRGAKNIKDISFTNNELLRTLNDIDLFINKLSLSGELEFLKASQIKEKYRKHKQSEKHKFNSYFRYVISTKQKSTARIYKNTLDTIEKYQKNELLFSDINLKWLRDFEMWLFENGSAINHVGLHMRNIRAVFNTAIDDDVISLALYPFRKYKIKKEKTIKRNLTIKEIKQLRDIELYGVPQLARDVFMLIFYLSGINLKDLTYLTKDNIRNGRIEYKRFKGGKSYSIKIEPEAKILIKKLRGTKYLIGLAERYKNYDSVKKEINKKLKDAAEKAGINEHISTYYARHSVATIGRNIGIPKDDIAAILGHADNTVTDIYIDLDQGVKDSAMRKILNTLR